MPVIHRLPQLQACWDSIVTAMNYRCRIEKGAAKSKNSNLLMSTAASPGSGKTHFLLDLCTIMSTEHKHPLSLDKATKLVNTSEADPSPLVNVMRHCHSCFITFIGDSSIHEREPELFGGYPGDSITVRILFAELDHKLEFNKFLEIVGPKLNVTLIQVVEAVLEARHKQHFFLAVDEVSRVESEWMKSEVGKELRSYQRREENKDYACCIKMLASINPLLDTPTLGFSCIASSVTSSVVDAYVHNSRKADIRVFLGPLLSGIPTFLDDIMSKRSQEKNWSSLDFDKEEDVAVTREHVYAALATTGAHPKLLANMMPWLCSEPVSASFLDVNKLLEVLHGLPSLSQEIMRNALLPGEMSVRNMALEEQVGVLTKLEKNASKAVPFLPSIVVLSNKNILGEYGGSLVQSLFSPMTTADFKFDLFCVNWFLLQSHLTTTINLRELFVSRFESCSFRYNMAKQMGLASDDFNNPSILFADKDSFLLALPSQPLSLAEQCDSNSSTFDCNVDGSFTKLVKPLSSLNPGFDFLIASQHMVNGKMLKHVVLFQCKTHHTPSATAATVSTSTEGGESCVDKTVLANSIHQCVDSGASWFFDNDWTVSLVIVCDHVDTIANCVSACVVKEEGGRWAALWRNTAVVTRWGLRDLLGPTLALRLELA